MLAQLVTDEAKPGSKEKWYVYSRSLPTFGKLPNDCLPGSMAILGSARTRSYLSRSEYEVVCQTYRDAETSCPR
jgi:hypothetical protein